MFELLWKLAHCSACLTYYLSKHAFCSGWLAFSRLLLLCFYCQLPRSPPAYGQSFIIQVMLRLSATFIQHTYVYIYNFVCCGIKLVSNPPIPVKATIIKSRERGRECVTLCTNLNPPPSIIMLNKLVIVERGNYHTRVHLTSIQHTKKT